MSDRLRSLSSVQPITNTLEPRERIKRLRTLRQWDQARVATAAGISTALLSQIENGRVAASDEQIDRLAAAFGCTADYLRAPFEQGLTTRPWLRAYADASRREAAARVAMITTAVEYVRRLDLHPLPDLLPHFDGDLDDDEAIEEAADELRHMAAIDSGEVVGNAVRAAERLGCVVLPLESELGRHMGMSTRSDDLPVMCVAKGNVPGDRQRFTVAHELGHLVLHAAMAPPKTADESTRMERQAHRFGAAFLAPGDALEQNLQELGGRVTLTSLCQLKAVWGVSVKALVHRFNALGVIDADQARSLYKQISARRWTKVEPVDVATETAQWFERTLTKKAKTPHLSRAVELLAHRVGGNPSDLFGFADWSMSTNDAQIVHILKS